MSFDVKLEHRDKITIIEALSESLTDKLQNVVRDSKKHAATKENYENAARKLMGEIKCGRVGTAPSDNIFGWVIDQIAHSPNVRNTQLGNAATDCARACAMNQYNRWRRRRSSPATLFDDLFDE